MRVVGYGPIAARQALAIAAEGIWRRLVCDPLSGTLLDYGRTRCHPPDTLKQFVVTRDQRCAAFECSSPRGAVTSTTPGRFFGGRYDQRIESVRAVSTSPSCQGRRWIDVDHQRRSIKTLTTPLGRARTEPPTRLIDPIVDRLRPWPRSRRPSESACCRYIRFSR